MAKMLRDLEVENGGNAPQIHSMDDYFMTEVEKVEDNDGSKSSSSGRSKKPVTKKVMEYCYEPDMEEVTATYGLSVKHVESIQENCRGGSFYHYYRIALSTQSWALSPMVDVFMWNYLSHSPFRIKPSADSLECSDPGVTLIIIFIRSPCCYLLHFLHYPLISL